VALAWWCLCCNRDDFGPQTGFRAPELTLVCDAPCAASCRCSGAAASRHLFSTDCNGGVHFLEGSPAELNVNARTIMYMLDKAAEGVRSRAACAW
jgi:hypothetical protein